nr:MAG TPA: hypothetical protein [Caudoviricetes sp.]
MVLSYKVNKINGLRIFQMAKYRYLILSFLRATALRGRYEVLRGRRNED